MTSPRPPVSATEILRLLPSAFDTAHKSGELFFFESSEKTVQSNGRPVRRWFHQLCSSPVVAKFHIRICPALLNKDKAKEEQSNSSPEPKRAKVEKKEPFRPPYVPQLYVGSLAGLEGERDLSVLVCCCV